MDPSAFGPFFPSPLATAIPPGMRYPFTPTSVGARGMVFYPQPLTVSESPNQPSVQLNSPSPPRDSPSPKRPVDKKLRRQIANSNERRRMQSINSGFHALRLLMPHLQGEKLSKASILQHAAEHIFRLNQERERLTQQNTALRVMLSRYIDGRGETCGDGKVSKATSPIIVDDEEAAKKELEEIFATRHRMEVIKEELERERTLRIRAEAASRALQDQLATDDSDDCSDSEGYSSRKRPRVTPEPKNNLDIIVRAIRQIEGDAFSRSTTPTCSTQERTVGFIPITTSTDSSRLSPVTPVYAS